MVGTRVRRASQGRRLNTVLVDVRTVLGDDWRRVNRRGGRVDTGEHSER